MENVDDIFKQMNRSSLAKDLAQDSAAGKPFAVEPRIVNQKEDIIYVKNPGSDWAQNGVLSIGRG